jgi:Cys-rich repeat protein
VPQPLSRLSFPLARLAVPLALVSFSLLGACSNQEYSECNDEGCFYCDGVGCRTAPPPGRAACDCGRPCADGSRCDETLGCVIECSVAAECPSGSTCVGGLCLGFSAPRVREAFTELDCSCSSDDECGDLLCIEGMCRMGCRTSDDCDAGFACVDATCVPTVTPDCDAERPCSAGLECVAGECRAPAATCQFSSECGTGRVCVNQQCTTECDAARPCATAGTTCVDGFCVETPPVGECVVNADCGEGRVCRDGACFDECSTDAECGTGRYCLEGRCRVDDRPRPSCDATRSCATGSVCLNGTCRIPCSTAPECAMFDVQYNFCLMGLCATTNEATSDCSAQADCMAGQSCVDGICR